jgi:lysophospholipase L1-like esterase
MMDKALPKHFIYAAIIILAVLALLEGGARLVESQIISSSSIKSDRRGWQTEFFGSLFDWHEPDPELLWRFKAGLDNPLITTNSDHFLGPEISRKKTANTYRVLIVGDSSPVGLGLKSGRQTFAEILRHLLDRHFESRKDIEIINAAVSGYSSLQVVRMLQIRGWAFDPDLVVVYCGNNDASISGVYSDSELLAGQRLKSLRSFFSHLALYRVMRGLLRPSGAAEIERESDLKVRVTPEEFGANLRDIVTQCREHNCPLIILKPPVPYLWPAGLQFKPFLHITGDEGRVLLPAEMASILGREVIYCLDEVSFGELYDETDVFAREVFRAAFRDTQTSEDAIKHYTTLISSNPEDPLWYNNLGVSLWRKGDYANADRVLDKAIDQFRERYPESRFISRSPALAAASSPILFNIGINKLYLDPAIDIVNLDTNSAAHSYLDSALQVDFFSLRIKRPYCSQIDSLCGYPGVAVIDMPNIFRENGGERLFIDHCHPTGGGHLLIAQTIYDTIIMRRW